MILKSFETISFVDLFIKEAFSENVSFLVVILINFRVYLVLPLRSLTLYKLVNFMQVKSNYECHITHIYIFVGLYYYLYYSILLLVI